MGALKTYYSEQIQLWIHHNNRRLSLFDVVEPLGKEYLSNRGNCSKWFPSNWDLSY